MFFGVLLIITWLILLLRYPAKALPVSLVAAVGLGFVAMWVVWLDNREAAQLARLELRISYAPSNALPIAPCSSNSAMAMTSPHRIALARRRLCAGRYGQPGRQRLCCPTLSRPRRIAGRHHLGRLPADAAAAPGYRPQTLEFRAERLQGSFCD